MRDYQGYEGRYAITEDGKVWSYKNQRYLKPYNSGNGYLKVGLIKDGVRHQYYVHQLVAQTYITNDDPENKVQVNHKDENKHNNSVSNLEWTTPKENTNYGSRTERMAKTHCKPVLCVELNKVFNSQVEASKELGVNAVSIGMCVNGKLKTAGGYHWERVRETREWIDRAIAADLLLLELEENCVKENILV